MVPGSVELNNRTLLGTLLDKYSLVSTEGDDHQGLIDVNPIPKAIKMRIYDEEDRQQRKTCRADQRVKKWFPPHNNDDQSKAQLKKNLMKEERRRKRRQEDQTSVRPANKIVNVSKGAEQD
jgi:hypothetical protein